MRSAVRVIHFNGQGKVSETYTTFGRVMATPQCFTVTDWKCISGKYKKKLQVELTVSSLLSPTSLMKFTFLFTFDIYLFLYFPWQSSGIYNRWVFKHFNGISFFKNCNDITKNWQKTGDNSILIDIIITELYVELFSYKIQRINF